MIDNRMQDAWTNAPEMQRQPDLGSYEALLGFLNSGGLGQLLGRAPVFAQAPAGYLNPQQRIADIEGAVGQDQQVPVHPQVKPQEAQPIRNQKTPITQQRGDGSIWVWDDPNQVWVPMGGI